MSRLDDITNALDAAPKVPLGELIEQCDERNYSGIYHINDVKGVSINKVIIDTKADMNGVSLSPYKTFKPSQFCFVPITSRNGEKITLSINNHRRTYIVSSSYCVFKVTNQERLLPMYLYLLFCRPEFDRYARFNSWGSAREAFSFDEMCRVRIPLPPIDVQKEYVDAYDGLQQLIRQNEALLKPLSDACQAYMAEVKSKYDEVTLGDYIEAIDIRNTDGVYDVNSLQGVTSDGLFDLSKAKTDGIDFSKYKIVKELDFAYNPSRINLGSIALRKGSDCIISPMYIVFGLKPNATHMLMHDYLFLWFMRTEFQRSTWFYASGSVRDTFSFDEMCRVRIPLPPIDVQKSIVALHKCAEEARDIAAEARETLRKMCPAMVQRASHQI